jgi:site-specific recombinase XerD
MIVIDHDEFYCLSDGGPQITGKCEHPHADFVFLSERKAPLSVDGAQKLIERLGEAAKLPFPIHAHMLRHAAGTPWRLVESTQGRCRPSWGIAR